MKTTNATSFGGFTSPYRTILMQGACLALLSLGVSCPLGAQETGDGRMTYPDPLPVLNADRATGKMDAAALVLREKYGPGGVAVSELFEGTDYPAFRSRVEVVGNELKLSGDDATAYAMVNVAKTIVYPFTLDLTMRMEIADDGWVMLQAVTNGKRATPQFRNGRLQDRPADASVLVNPGELQTYRFVFDSEGRGRVYLMDGSERSLPVGCVDIPNVPVERSSVDLRMKNAKVFIEEAALYLGMP